MSFKVLVRENQFFDDKFTIGDVVRHFAERTDLETETADMLFFSDFKNNKIAVITRNMYQSIMEQRIPFHQYAIEYMDDTYPFIREDDVERFTETECPQDTPVVDKSGVPKYVIIKGYKKTTRTEHFICNVLSGLSSYDLSVNADMTVSCHCKLRKGGELGNLRRSTLFEIYASEHVNRIREAMFHGFLPTCVCFQRCGQLRQVPWSIGQYFLKNYTVPKSIMFENTSICNLKCENCYNALIDHATVTLEDTERFAKEVKQNNIKMISLFKYGEPFLDKDLGEKIRIIRDYSPNVKISVSTNGMLLDINNNIENALCLDKIIFSLDGVDDKTVSSFQKSGSFSRIYTNMKALIERRNAMGKTSPRIIWKYVLFLHNQDDAYIERAFDLAIQAGVDNLVFRRGFNVMVSADAMWKSKVFLPYLKKYRFTCFPPFLRFDLTSSSENKLKPSFPFDYDFPENNLLE